MNKFVSIAVVSVVAVVAFVVGLSWPRHQGSTAVQNTDRKILYYVDPMNPAHTTDKPGKAPCGMDMEPVYADDSGSASTGPSTPGTVKVSLEKQQLIGLRVGTAEKRALSGTLRLPGKVAVDETRIYRINATVDGWVTMTKPVAAGSRVAKNETLAGFYSPDFLSAGQALLFALSSADRVKATGNENAGQLAQLNQFALNLRQYEDSLRNLGMGPLQIEEMIKTRKYIENVDIVSPADGFIITRNVSDGQRFDKGTELFRIADLSQIWVLVDLFEKDSALLTPKAMLTVSLPNQDKSFMARVSDSLPQFDNLSRTIKLRLEVDNPEFVLKPDMFVDVEIPVNLPEAVVAPADAILGSAVSQTVFLDRGNGYFEPRKVRTGARLHGQVQILEGLEAHERIVVSGNFLLDSESKMKMAAADLQHQAKATDPVCKMSVDEAKAKATGRFSDHGGKSYYFCADGCKQAFDKDPAKFLGDTKPMPMEMAGTKPGRSIDPVCKMSVDEAKAKAAGRLHEHAGKTYYFCNDSCKETFAKNPTEFLGDVKPHEMPGATAQPARSTDPVCGMLVTEEKARAAGRMVSHAGKTYYFCNDGCKAEFTADPKKFIGTEETAHAAMPAADQEHPTASHTH